VVETFKLRPDLLIVLLFMGGVMVAAYYGRRAVEEKHEAIMTELIERCMEPAKR
jgi:hypothetical protein